MSNRTRRTKRKNQAARLFFYLRVQLNLPLGNENIGKLVVRGLIGSSITQHFIMREKIMSCDKNHIPNEETVKAMEELDAGKNLFGPFDTVEELFEDLEKD